MITRHLEDEIKNSNKTLEYLGDRIRKIEEDRHLVSKQIPLDTFATFRDNKENMSSNFAENISKYSTTRATTAQTIDRADLLIMCNKIKEDVKKSMSDTLKSHQFGSMSIRAESQPITRREHTKEVRTSIDKFRQANADYTTKTSPVKRIKHHSRRTSSGQGIHCSESNRSAQRTIDPNSNLHSRGSSKDFHLSYVKNLQGKQLDSHLCHP